MIVAQAVLRGDEKVKKAIVIGSGAGGAAAAKKLQESGDFAVTILEAGGEFKSFSLNMTMLEKLRRTGFFFDEREIQLLFPTMQVRKVHKTKENMVMVNGIGLGGTTTISAGNALRVDGSLKELGINLDDEFDDIYKNVPITYEHEDKWRDSTKKLFAICNEMNLNPSPIPKLGDYSKCTNCGNCVLGCRFSAKWDSRQFVTDAVRAGAKLITGCKVLKIVSKKGKAKGVYAQKGLQKVFYAADVVVLAAGGFSTPVILQNSGIECENHLFVDPVLCVAAEYKGAFQNKELSMPFAVQKDNYILSPYFDHLSFFFNKKWMHSGKDILSLMVKLADTPKGGVDHNTIHKTLTKVDKERLSGGVALCTEIFERFGIKKSELFLGTLNAGHPGGMLPLTTLEAETFHNPRLPKNLYIADATLFPKSLGNPPILTIMAMAQRVAKIIIEG